VDVPAKRIPPFPPTPALTAPANGAHGSAPS
jgi:hypothetical protein